MYIRRYVSASRLIFLFLLVECCVYYVSNSRCTPEECVVDDDGSHDADGSQR